MEAISEIADRYGLIVIEDACQAHGAKFNGRRVGSYGTACYSFYPTKNMTTGEGGMVTTDDAAIADRVRLLRSHGMRQRYVHETLGYNFRMMDLQAAIGLAELAKSGRVECSTPGECPYLTEGFESMSAITTRRSALGRSCFSPIHGARAQSQ